jgi:N-acyl-D-aspartate/D-glutamate deacylase
MKVVTPPKSPIEQIWAVFVPHDSFELRAIWPKGTKLPDNYPASWVERFRRDQYKALDEYKKNIEARAMLLNDRGYNVYAVMNPIKASATSDAASDADIDYRDLVLIDIDRRGNTQDPATDAEVAKARQMADKIEADLRGWGWPPAIKVMSGNGYHLYFELEELPNTDEVRDAIRELLKSLDDTYGCEVLKVDTSVYNASRITKVPGTVMRKGTESADRPHRRAEVL